MSGVTVSAGTLVVILGAMRANAGGDTVVASDSVNGTTGWNVVSHNRSGETAIGFIAWSLMPSGLSSGSITIADGSGAASASHIAFGAYSISGSASSSVNDGNASNGNDQGATTTPSITSGTPANAGDMFFVVYCSPNGNSGAYTEDGAWNNLFSKLGDTALTCSAAYVVNAGSGTKTHAPTTGNALAIQEITAFIVAGGTVNNQTVSVNTTPNPAIVRQTGKIQPTNSTPNPSIVRLTGKIVSGNTTPNGSIVRSTNKIVGGNTVPNPAIVRTTGKIASIDTTPNPSIARSTGKIVSGNTTPTPAMTEVQHHQFTQTVSVDTTPVPSIATVFTPFTPTADLHVIRIASPPKLKVDRTGS